MKKRIILMLAFSLFSIFIYVNRNEQYNIKVIQTNMLEMAEPLTANAVYWDEAISKSENGRGLKSYLENKGLLLNNVTKIVFNDINKTKNEYTSDKIIDISKNKDNSVKALIKDNVLYIQFRGTLYLNEDSSMLFFNFGNITDITGLEYINTSKVTNMSGLFLMCENLTNLDLSNFNTNEVTDMSNIFGSTN